MIFQKGRWSVVGRSPVLAREVGEDGNPARFESSGDGERGTYHQAALPTVDRARGPGE